MILTRLLLTILDELSYLIFFKFDNLIPTISVPIV